MTSKTKNKSHLLIPDLQVKPGGKTDHLDWIGRYIAAKKPDVIVQIGDWWDMPSLSSYDMGKKAAEGKRVPADFKAGCESVTRLMKHWKRFRSYKPRLIFTEGNHEQRIRRYENDFPHLSGSLPRPLDYLAERGWECYPFLQPAVVDGICYSHFFPRTSKGTVSAASARNGASSAFAQLKNNMMTCIAGHRQGYDTAMYNVGATRYRSIIAGSCYLHDEGYMGPQGNDYWRGILMLHRVKKGNFDLCEVSLDYLKERYGK